MSLGKTYFRHIYIQLVTMYKQYGSVQGYLETPRYPWSF